MAGTEFVGSHEKAQNGYGQNGSPQASSLTPGETKSPIADVSPPQHGVEGQRVEDTIGHRVHMGADGKAAAYTPHDGMRNRSTSAVTIPSVNVRGANPGQNKAQTID